MSLIEIETEQKMRREAAAAWLHGLADALERHNEVTFVREGIRFHVAVRDEVELEVELDVAEDGSSIEVEISW